jgi:DNA-binding MarR family transcriptional regulator
LKEDLQNALIKNGQNICLDKDYLLPLNAFVTDAPVLSLPEMEVLLLFNNEDAKSRGFSFGFQGIKRRLDIHQQRLTLALRRLVRKGIIAKNEDKEYLLTRYGKILISNLFGNNDNKATYTLDSMHCDFPSCEVEISVNSKRMDHKTLAKKLKGKWFSHYRYVGSCLGEDTSTLEWITDDSRYSARVSANEEGNIRITVAALQFCEGLQLREEANKISSFIKKSITELFGESQICQVKFISTKKSIFDPNLLNKWVEEIYKPRTQHNYS